MWGIVILEEKQHKAVHRLQLTDRREGSITGVKDVQSFDEKEKIGRAHV